MASDQRWKWAGIVSVVSIGGVLITDIVANVVGEYISDQIKASWQVPEEAAASREVAMLEPETVSSIPRKAVPQAQPQAKVAAAASKPLPAPEPEVVIASESMPLPEPEPEIMATHAPLPPEPRSLMGTVEQVIDTATLKIRGETIMLAGIRGLGSPYRDQLAKFIEEQGSQLRCMPSGEHHICFVGSIDLGLAALTNGAARLAADATPQYRQAEQEARRHRRGIFQ